MTGFTTGEKGLFHCYLAMIIGAMLFARVSPLAQAADAPETLFREAAQAMAKGDHSAANDLLTKVLAADANRAEAYYARGRELFCLGKVTESLADFDKYVQLQPKAESRQWERGISCYYAGDFERGAKQFELYQTYHNQDVENSAWRYLCVAKAESVEKAKMKMLPIDNDPRVPMMEIYELYRGKLKPADVLAAANAGNPREEGLNTRLFYAHLYLGLWYEVGGDAAAAKENILAAEKHKIGHYMWDVAHIHADRLRAAK